MIKPKFKDLFLKSFLFITFYLILVTRSDSSLYIPSLVVLWGQLCYSMGRGKGATVRKREREQRLCRDMKVKRD